MIQGKTTCRYCVDYMAWEKGHRKFHVMLRVNVRKMFVQYLRVFVAYLVNVPSCDIKFERH